MFFQGNLQEGIALAVSQAKAVVCFVRGALWLVSYGLKLRKLPKDDEIAYANCYGGV